MRVVLAGYNVDSTVLEELKRNSPPREDVTPETLSASYARISRDPRPVDELRAAARAEVDRTRRSNQSIIFKMGHHSVAEHAVFNFDVIGVSRLAIEEIERFRLMSFTEKSQRYITLGEDFVIPEEVRRSGLEAVFVKTVKAQNALYHRLYARLKPFVLAKYAEAAADPRNHAVLDGWAKEDARYAVSLATQGQLGLTANARSLELLIRRFAAKAETYPDLARAAESWPARRSRARSGKEAAKSVRLAAAPEDGDDRVIAALLHSVTRWSYDECLGRARSAVASARRDIVRRALGRMEFYDFPPREFEHADLVYDLTVSASCFAQLKRHRMATLTWQRPDPALGVTVPPSIREAGAEREFLAVVDRTDETHARLERAIGPAADYVLTNAHRRRALVKVNVRELYHISRLRQDATAQWEIRDIAEEMSRLAAKAMPLACLLLGGKDAYPSIYAKIFGRPPQMVPPRIFK